MIKEKKKPFREFIHCFETCDEIRAQHLLFEDFKKERTDIERSVWHKMAFYVMLNRNQHKAKTGKDAKGNFGYGLKYLPK